MNYFCPQCGTRGDIDDDQIPQGGMRIACAQCTFPIELVTPSPTPSPAPAPSASSPPSAPDLTTGADARLRFSDLILALKWVPDVRALLVGAAGIAASFLILSLLIRLGAAIANEQVVYIFMGLGTLAFSVLLIFASATITAMFTARLHEGIHLSISDALSRTVARVAEVYLLPAALVGLLIGVVIVESLVGLAGRIPYAGPLFFGVLYAVLYALSVAALLLMLGGALIGPLYTAGLFATPDASGRDVLRTTLRLAHHRLPRFLGCLGITAAVYLLLLFGIIAISGGASALTHLIASSTMDNHYPATIAGSTAALISPLSIIDGLPRLMTALLRGTTVDFFPFQVAGFFVRLGTLVVESLLLSTLLVYAQAASVVTRRFMADTPSDLPD